MSAPDKEKANVEAKKFHRLKEAVVLGKRSEKNVFEHIFRSNGFKIIIPGRFIKSGSVLRMDLRMDGGNNLSAGEKISEDIFIESVNLAIKKEIERGGYTVAEVDEQGKRLSGRYVIAPGEIITFGRGQGDSSKHLYKGEKGEKEMRIPRTQVSRKHFELEIVSMDDSAVRIKDLQSTNGTIIDINLGAITESILSDLADSKISSPLLANAALFVVSLMKGEQLKYPPTAAMQKAMDLVNRSLKKHASRLGVSKQIDILSRLEKELAMPPEGDVSME